MHEVYEKVLEYIEYDITRVKELTPDLKDEIYRSTITLLGDEWLTVDFCEQQSNAMYCAYHFRVQKVIGDIQDEYIVSFVSLQIDDEEVFQHFDISALFMGWLVTH